jgi:hypothetical protein
LPVAALGPVFGPSHGALTATDAFTAFVAFASAAEQPAAAVALVAANAEPAINTAVALSAIARFLNEFTFLLIG